MEFDRVIMEPLVTEKLIALREEANQYLFAVHPDANKIEIRKAIESMFDVSVEDVRTMNVRGKEKRVRWAEGYTPDWKKAIVRLPEGEVIEEVEGLLA